MKRSLLMLLLSVAWLRAELVLAPVFTDHMVLHATGRCRSGGRATPGVAVTVEFALEKQAVRAYAGGQRGTSRVAHRHSGRGTRIH